LRVIFGQQPLEKANPATSLSVRRVPDGIAKSSAAVAPIKNVVAFFVSGLLQVIELLYVVDHCSYAMRELAHRSKGQIVQPGRQRQAGNAAF
jgi:hypothetical protein